MNVGELSAVQTPANALARPDRGLERTALATGELAGTRRKQP